MVRHTVFERGDIIRVCLNPTTGRELQGDFRPALVLSLKKFNTLGMTLVAPITQGGDFSRFAVFRTLRRPSMLASPESWAVRPC